MSTPLSRFRQFLLSLLLGVLLRAISSSCKLVSQPAATWNLARISHRNSYARYTFVYDTKAGEGVFVYVVDSGISVQHDEFYPERAILGRNYIIKEPNDDMNGHGTGIAGIIAGRRYGIAKK